MNHIKYSNMTSAISVNPANMHVSTKIDEFVIERAGFPKMEIKKYNDSYYMIKTDCRDEWINKINIYSKLKKISENDILRLISHFISTSENLMSDLEIKIRNNKINTNELLIMTFINCQEKCFKNNIIIELINNDVSKWTITFENKISMCLTFDMIKFPNEHPNLLQIQPHKIYEKLTDKISKSKLFTTIQWNKSFNIYDLIMSLKQIITEYGQRYIMDEYDGCMKQSVDELCTILTISSSYLNIDNIFDSVFLKKDDRESETSNASHERQPVKKQINRGTGYDSQHIHDDWDVSIINTKMSEQNGKIITCLDNILTQFKRVSERDFEYLSTKTFIDCIILILDNTLASRGSEKNTIESVMIMSNIISILQNIGEKYFESISQYKLCGKTLLDVIIKISNGIEKTSYYFLKNKIDDIKNIIINASKNFEQKQLQLRTIAKSKSQSEEYEEKMSEYKFGETDIIGKRYHYSGVIKSKTDVLLKANIEHIMTEYNALSSDLPIQFDASIFVRIDPECMNAMRTIITGPKDTPYENGCFVFDIHLPNNYPNKCPEIQFMNHGGKRFNPNLYENGKVCLSLIGTWGNNEHKGESWNPKTSTIFQLLLSIQSQILIEEPWRNEPGRYSSNDERSKMEIKKYNTFIEGYTFRYAIIELIQNSESLYGSEISTIVKEHFKRKKNTILEKYCNMTLPENKQYFQSYKHIIENL